MAELPSLRTAEETAEHYLSPLGNRWLHTRSVASRAAELATAVTAVDRQLLLVAAWWHDIGYSPELAIIGFHPLDGAQFVKARGYSDRLAALIAHHSAAEFEASERGLLSELERWPRERSAVSDALWTADMTTGPDGSRVAYPARLMEILGRYGSDSTVGRAMESARPQIERAIERTTSRIA